MTNSINKTSAEKKLGRFIAILCIAALYILLFLLDNVLPQNSFTLMLVPVLKKGAATRKVALPAGKWVHLWTGKEYRGGRRHTVKAPLGKIPVFYRRNGDFADLFRQIGEQF